MNKFVILTFTTLFLSGCNVTQEQVINPIIDSAIENRQSIKPLLLLEPMYPKKELEDGIQGSCQVSFDLVNSEKFGSSPSNIEAVKCTNLNFLAACKDALKRWRFKKVEELSTDESVLGLRHTCKFELTRV